MDFAFFAANLGYSKADYEALTLREKAFILKAWENRLVSETTFIYNAVFTAAYNVNRGKRKRALKLWRKTAVKRADMGVVEENVRIMQEVEQREGKSWVDLIYKANHLKRPERKREDG